jgi:16S rRNA (cytosine1402-N4)-methyltransferase
MKKKLERAFKLHKPVLLQSVLSYLDPKPGQIILDGTLGSGGHAEAILEKLGPNGRLIGLDQDESALQRAKEHLKRFQDQVIFKHLNYTYIAEVLDELNLDRIDAVLLDIGLSTDQLDDPERGFSFLREGPLDMRMNAHSDQMTAAHVLRKAKEDELILIFQKLGEERFSRRIAHRIASTREQHPIETTTQLKSLIEAVVPGKFRFGRTHPATRIFQALRIAVNDELTVLRNTLPVAFERLRQGGRLAVISFHSLEDRIVKRFWVDLKKTEQAAILTKKPIQADELEVQENPRARSAKLRVGERIS